RHAALRAALEAEARLGEQASANQPPARGGQSRIVGGDRLARAHEERGLDHYAGRALVAAHLDALDQIARQRRAVLRARGCEQRSDGEKRDAEPHRGKIQYSGPMKAFALAMLLAGCADLDGYRGEWHGRPLDSPTVLTGMAAATELRLRLDAVERNRISGA